MIDRDELNNGSFDKNFARPIFEKANHKCVSFRVNMIIFKNHMKRPANKVYVLYTTNYLRNVVVVLLK